MPATWRIVKQKHAHQAFDGEGARLYGGRWNSPGIPLVYTSESLALAALEMLVHLDQSRVLSSYVVFPVRFDASLVTSVDEADLPTRWRDYPARPELQAIGDRWAAGGTSVVLEVPSAVVDGSNYLLNPAHPDFRSLSIGPPRPFRFDPRLVRTSSRR
jgi:RES domain-containing protein